MPRVTSSSFTKLFSLYRRRKRNPAIYYVGLKACLTIIYIIDYLTMSYEWVGHYYHYADEETKPQGSKASCPRSLASALCNQNLIENSVFFILVVAAILYYS